MSAEQNLKAFTGNGNVSIWEKKSIDTINTKQTNYI